jgi:ferrochelatase
LRPERSACCSSISARPMRRPRRGAALSGEFLSDRRVVEIPRSCGSRSCAASSCHAAEEVGARLWAGLARGRIAARRDHPRAGGGAEGTFGPAVIVDHAMRYGKPAIGRADRRLKARAASASWSRRSIRNIAPRRPQRPTTPPSPRWQAMRWQPALRTLPPYHDDPAYIWARLKASVEERLAALDFTPDVLLASFHGMPSARCIWAIPIIATARRPRGC